MAEQFLWKRYWYPRENDLELTAYGFLPEVTSETKQYTNPQLTTLEDISLVPCVVLLGEPGIGKSETIRAEASRLSSVDQTAKVIVHGFREFGSEAGAFRNLFDSEEVIEWKRGSQSLILFLDALDEGLLQISNWVPLLSKELSRWPVNRLKLRISCRPAVWPSSLEASLKLIWPDEQMKVMELAPLQEVDVRHAATRVGLDEEAFVTAIEKGNAGAFAARPLTLKFLLSEFKSDSRLPSSHRKLYKAGCAYLCREWNSARVEAGSTGALRAEQRYEIAQRLAALSIFCNKDRIARMDLPAKEDEILDFSAIIGGYEPLRMDAGELREVLDTGLFGPSKDDTLVWAHLSYAEFLAGEYVGTANLPLEMVYGWITVEIEGERRVAPQALATAAWLCEQFSPLRSWILRDDPFVLLLCDDSVLNDSLREDLTTRLLDLSDRYRLREGFFELSGKLKHPNLFRQLQRCIPKHRQKSQASRQRAIDIAVNCQVSELDSELLGIAQDQSEDIGLRVHALFAISRIGTPTRRYALRGYAMNPPIDDDKDEIKGWSLAAVWPSAMSSTELFKSLTIPKETHFLGGYGSFLYGLARSLKQQLRADELLLALTWAGQLDPHDIQTSSFGTLADSVILYSIEHTEIPAVANALANVILQRVKEHLPILTHDSWNRNSKLQEAFATNVLARRRIMESLVRISAANKVDGLRLAMGGLFLPEDCKWAMENYAASTPDEKAIIATLIDFMPDVPDKYNAIFRGIESEWVKGGEFRSALFVILASPDALALAKGFREANEYQQQPKPLLTPPPEERVGLQLEKIKNGDSDAWMQLVYDLNLTPESTAYSTDLQTDVTLTHGWNAANGAVRAEILAAAKQYLCQAQVRSMDFIGSNNCPYWAMTEYCALLLLLKFGNWSELLQFSDEDTNLRRCVVSLWYPFERESERQRNLVRSLSESLPKSFAAAVRLLLGTARLDCYSLANTLSASWNDEVDEVVLEFLKREPPTQCWKSLLEAACKSKRETLIAFAESNVVNARAQSGSDEYGIAIASATALLISGVPGAWNTVYSFMSEGPDGGRKLIEGIAFIGDEYSVPVQMDNASLADLYIWLEAQYPASKDPQHSGGAYTVGTRDSIAHLRNAALSVLRTRGALKEIEKVIAKFPNVTWLKDIREETLKAHVRNRWSPVLPDDVLKLANASATKHQSETFRFWIAIIGNCVAGAVFLLLPSLSKLEALNLFFNLVFLSTYFLGQAWIRRTTNTRFWCITAALITYTTATVTYLYLR